MVTKLHHSILQVKVKNAMLKVTKSILKNYKIVIMTMKIVHINKYVQQMICLPQNNATPSTVTWN